MNVTTFGIGYIGLVQAAVLISNELDTLNKSFTIK